MLAAYTLPAVAVWALAGLALTAAPLAGIALPAAVAFGACYAAAEISGRGLRAPGSSWQVPQAMLIGASLRRRVLVWGALLGPGVATRNPYAGFWLLPLAIAAMPGPAAGIALGAAAGLAHGAVRGAALLRDVREQRGDRVPAAAAAVEAAAGVPTHLDVLLKTVYWRRLDGAVLAAAAVTALAAWLHYLT